MGESVEQCGSEGSGSVDEVRFRQEEYIRGLEQQNKALSEENEKLSRELSLVKHTLNEAKTMRRQGDNKYLEDKCKILAEMCDYWKTQAQLLHKKAKHGSSAKQKKNIKKIEDEMVKLEQERVGPARSKEEVEDEAESETRSKKSGGVAQGKSTATSKSTHRRKRNMLPKKH